MYDIKVVAYMSTARAGSPHSLTVSFTQQIFSPEHVNLGRLFGVILPVFNRVCKKSAKFQVIIDHIVCVQFGLVTSLL